MNPTAAVGGNAVENYLSRLRETLRGIPENDRDDIVREIRAHIVDAAPSADTGAIGRILASLGTPQVLGERYLTQLEISRAAHSSSPWLLIQTAWRWATISVKGFAAFLVGFIGYSAGIAFYLTAMLKPFVPRIGFWVGPGTVVIGYPASQAGVREILGPYYIPFAFATGFGLFYGTTQLLRLLMRRPR